MKFRELRLRKNAECPVCSEHPTVTQLIDYEQFCGVQPEPVQGQQDDVEMAPIELKKRLDRGENIFLLDVREPMEWNICRLPGATLIPLGQVPHRMHELNSADFIVAYCRSGARSLKAVQFLHNAGFRKIKNLTGGTLAWSDQVDPSMPKY
jgi:rhodanese-related sulfurtransferase